MFDFSVTLEAASLAVLNATEHLRAARFLRREDQLRYAATRAALRYILGKRLQRPPATLVIENDANGRPALRGDVEGALDFNVSHSGRYAWIAIAQHKRVGVDIELRQPTLDWRALAPFVFGPDDSTYVDALPESRKLAAFYDVWVAKEALLKAHGIGIVANMTGFSVSPCGAEVVPEVPAALDARVVIQPSSDEMKAYEAVRCVAPEGYAACVAWSKEP